MEDALAEFELAQAQQAILDSINFEAEVDHHFLREADMELDEALAPVDDKVEAPPFCPATNDHEVGGSGTNVIDISVEE